MAKAQISLYLIIMVFVIVALSLFLVFQQKIKENKNEVIDRVSSDQIEYFVSQCVKDTSVPVMYEMASRSGYLYLPINSLKTDYSEIAYYFDNGSINVITEQQMKVQLQDYMNMMLPKCLGNFSSFQNVQIDYGYVDTSVTFSDSETIFQVSMPLSVSNGKKSVFMFTSKVPVRMSHLRKISDEITGNIADDPLWLDMTALSSYDVDVSMLPYNDSVIVFSLIDKASSIGADPFVYLFAVRYEIHDIPYFEIPLQLNLTDNVPFSYRIIHHGSDEDLIFHDNTPMFDIKNGWINFTPKVTGEFDVRITAENRFGLKTEKYLKVIVDG